MNPNLESDLDRRLARDPVAIVGLSALFPKSPDLGSFWGNVMSAADCIEEVPAGHWDVNEHYDPDPSVPDKTYANRGGFIPDVPFNPLEFGLPPNTLEVTDVLQLLSLVVARDLLADAGAGQSWYDPTRTGVILGITGANQLTQPLSARLQTPVLKEVVRSCGLSDRDAEEIAEKFKLAFAPWEENSFPGMLGNVVAGRIANRLDLGGTNMTIDAACASSLGAVKAAVSELLEGRADTMLTGGCDAENTIFMYLCFSKTPAFSKSGHIRPFDKNADGTLIGEGIGMLALRRLADAERDGNRIYAVLRGMGSSSDGRFKSIYAPRKEGQTVALRRAYEDAMCAPDSVELFEAHGTGTAVGDATELSALAEVVSASTDQKQYAAIGSVKSQIGHTKAAAGAAGLIKLSMALHNRVLPPTINVDEPNPAIDFASGPLYVNTAARPWIRDPHRPERRAAISSFGFGGTNFHFVLQEHGTGEDTQTGHPVAAVHLWHAPDTAALTALLADDAAPVAGPVPAGHARIALAATGDAQLAELKRVALDGLRARPDTTEWSHPKGVHFRARAAEPGKVGALFAGQGSQYVDAGLTAVMALPPLRAAFDRANRHFEGTEPLSRAAFPIPVFSAEDRAAQEESLRRTEYAQPAIGALSAGQYGYLRELGFRADGFLGHSFGELTALWASGALADDDFFALARARGKAMAPPDTPGFDAGAMVSLTAGEDKVAELLREVPGVVVCNRNAADQIVVGGPTDAVVRLLEVAAAAGVQAKRLPVSAAFHTPLVAHALDAFRDSLADVTIARPAAPVFANTPGASYGDDADANRRVLAEQLVNPVAFADRVEEMYAAGFRTFVEFGPKGVLGRLVGRILGGREHTVLSLDAGPGKDADLALKQSVARLAVLGLPLETADRYVAAPRPVRQTKGMTIMLNGINYVSDARKAAYRNALENGYRVAQVTAGSYALAPAASVPAVSAVAAPVSVPVPQPASASVSAAASVGGGAVATLPAPAPAAAVRRPEPALAGPSPSRSTPTPAGGVTTADVQDRRTVNDPNPAPRAAVPAAYDALPGAVADHLTMHHQYLDGQLETARQLTELLAGAGEQGRLDAILPGVTAVKEHGLAIGRTHLRANETLQELARLEYGAAAPVRPTALPPAAVPAPAAYALAPSAPVAAAALPPAAPVRVPEPAHVFEPVRAPEPVVAPAPVTPAPVPPAAVAAPAPAPAPAALDADAVREALLDVVAAKTGYPADMLDPAMDIEADLGIDSIKRVEVLGVLQERFPGVTSVGPEQLGELRTLDDIVGFVVAGAGESAAPASAVPAPAAPASPAVDADAVRSVLLEVVAAKTGYPADMLDPAMDIEADLGIDSIKRVEVLGVLQERFPDVKSVGPEQLGELRTLDDIVGFVVGDTPAGPAEPAAPAAAHTAAAAEATTAAAPAQAAAPQAPGIGRAHAALAEVPAPDRLLDVYPSNAPALVVDDGGDFVPAAVARLSADGWQVHVLRLPGVPQRLTDVKDHALTGWGANELAARVEEIAADHLHLVLVPATRQDTDWRDGVRQLTHGLLLARHVVEPLRASTAAGRAAFVTVTALDGGFGLGGVDESLAPAGGFGGLVKTLAIEAPEVFCRGVDLAPGLAPEDAAALVVAELTDAAAGPVQVGHDGRRRLTLSLAATPLSFTDGEADSSEAPALTPDDLLVVTGGGRGITARCAVELATRYRSGLLLLGRTVLGDEPGWAAGVEGAAELKAAAVGQLRADGEKPSPKRVEQLYQEVIGAREIRSTLALIRGTGAFAEYLAVDITDGEAVRAVLAPYEARITGLVHGAGVLADQLIAQKKAAEVERVFAPKLGGLRAVVAALPEDRLRHVVLFSSVAGFFGNRGQSDYAMANEVLNVWAAAFKRRHPRARVTSLNWGAWDSGMVSPQLKAVFAERGIRLIDTETGPRLFAEQFAAEHTGDVVTVLGPTSPLSSREAAPPSAGIVVERRLDDVAQAPVVTDHVIGDAPVLPATVALGWLIGAVERLTGATVRQVRDFAVHKGVVFDGAEHTRFHLTAAPGTEPGTTDVAVRSLGDDGSVRPRYAARVPLAADPAPAPRATGLPALGGGRDAAGFYTDGTLFHGPALRGVRRVAAEDGERLVLECALPEQRPGAGAFNATLYGPGTADLLLQAALVWNRLHRGTASLPLSVAQVDLYRALPDAEPFLVAVEPAEEGGQSGPLTVTAYDPVGEVLARFTGVSVVSSPQLAAKFANR